ncbi:hemerythrin domain-containing protein [Nocardioides sp. SYSU DS0651]|uniref:hemerythrin domain-containing protein n=1 Tax=Nocardioides sp. SYSU DS0651 TaxID=3415955 RepID=UPI003F4C775C
MRSLAQQTEAELGGGLSVLVRQKRDHTRLDRLLDRLAATREHDDKTVLREIARLVFPHAFAEEAVLWPQARRVLDDGEALTLRVEQEHQEINALWARLEGEELTAPDRGRLRERIAELLREDVRDEEDDLLPRLQTSLDRTELRRLGLAWELTRRIAPTRPHPVVSRRPPGNALSAVPLAILDRTRDRLDALSERGASPPRERLTAVSAALARVAGRVEQRRVLRRGEESSTHVE